MYRKQLSMRNVTDCTTLACKKEKKKRKKKLKERLHYTQVRRTTRPGGDKQSLSTSVRTVSCKMFPLAKLAYYACSDDEKFIYDELETLKIDIQPCCIDIIRYQQKKSTLNIGEYDIAVQFMDDEDYTMSEKAAASGHIMCLEFAEGCGFPWTRRVRARAAKNAINCRNNTRF
ncbi:uncharacterized protein LOC126552137 [Aphis gossypii]|uniref:uncharacterized protein LOC126552137 n=1 Tax=Aphis gossypii TaxID=80765 RepID=UPI0021590CC5|nr:uncharacterized protein LOC126552137 [Aphis gossypii]